MENELIFEELETYQNELKRVFKEFATGAQYYKWAETFEIAYMDDKQVTLTYHGALSIGKFKKQCKKTLADCISSLVGDEVKLKIIKKSGYKEISSQPQKKLQAAKFFIIGLLFICLATATVYVLGNYIENRKFRETFYSTSSIKVDSRVRVIQISDLHGVTYGKNNAELIRRIKALKPDIILCTGDIVNSTEKELDYAVSLAKEISKIAPSYYIYGNNEVEGIYDFPLKQTEMDQKFGFDEDSRNENALLELKDPFEAALEAEGIKVLKNEKDTITVKSMTVDVYGVLTSNPSSFWSYSGKAFSDYIYENPENLKITAIHEPVLFEEFQPDFWGDLMVCGHTHGGIVRVPLLGPLYTHEGGLFPERDEKFVYGRYDTAGRPLIVSSGLENTNILRLNNPPELVVIDINKF